MSPMNQSGVVGELRQLHGAIDAALPMVIEQHPRPGLGIQQSLELLDRLRMRARRAPGPERCSDPLPIEIVNVDERQNEWRRVDVGVVQQWSCVRSLDARVPAAALTRLGP